MTYKAVLLDIEGTTTPISFVHDKLFPYIRNNVAQYLVEHWEKKETIEDVHALRALSHEDLRGGTENAAVLLESGDKQKDIAATVAFVLHLMDGDRKVTALKQLQGHMWRDAYARRAVIGELFDDVYPAMQKWVAEGIQINIYSSGSVEAQKLLFGHTAHGDLIPMINAHFDTKTGSKTEAESYKAIAKELRFGPEDILFVSDNIKEISAASGAGMLVCLSIREGNAPVPPDEQAQVLSITSFSQIPRVMSRQ